MATLALGLAGAGIGSAFGGALGASIGFQLGSALGSLLFPEKVQGPRLDDLKLHNSSYGQVTPWLWGTMRIPGNIIDEQSELTEHSETSGGKGGPEVTNYTYSASFAARVCKGPIQGLTRIWANGRIIYDVTGTSAVGADLPFVLYLGDEDQLPDPTLEGIHGVGNVPAYRGIAYIVFTDLSLTDYGNTLPVLNFEVGTKAHTNSAIRVLYENLSESYTWAQNDLDLFPVIDAWPLYTGTVRIGGIPFGSFGYTLSPTTAITTVETYNATPDLAYIAPDLDVPMFFPYPWAVDTGVGFTNYSPIGIYALSDGAIPLWLSPFSFSSSPSTYRPNVGGQDMVGDGTSGGVIGVSWSDLLGVQAGETVVAASLSSDGARIILFTAATTFSSTVTKWYEAIAGVPTRNGTVSPSLTSDQLGLPGPTQTTRTVTNSFEQGGRFLWVINGMNGGFAGDVKVYEIDPVTNNLAYNATCGTLSVGVTDGTHTGAAFSMEDGYCGWAGGNNLIVFTRFPEGETLKVRLSEIVADLSDADGAGLDAADYDVTDLTDLVDGFLVTQQASARDLIQPLRDAYFFDATEEDDVVRFVKRGKAPVVTIPEDDLAAHVAGEDVPPAVGLVRVDDLQLPATVNVNYIDPARDYQQSTQVARRQVSNSQAAVTLTLPISMSAAKAKAVAEAQLYSAEVERNRLRFSSSRKYWKYGPTDVVSIGGRSIAVRDKTEVRAGVIQFEGVESLEQIFAQAGNGVAGEDFTTSPPSPPSARATTTTVLLDIPLVADDDVPVGYYAAMSGGGSWPGAKLMKSVDGGTTYAEVGSTSIAATMGTASDVLEPFFGGNIFDEGGIATVVLTSGELASATELAVLNGANEAVLGDEVIQFKSAELVDDDTYELTGLLRGRLGTEWAMGSHSIGERFVLLPVLRVADQFSEINRTRDFKPVTLGGTVASTTAQGFTDTGASLRPYSPVLLGGGTDGSGNVTLNWTRRTRSGGAWAGTAGLPLSETTEAYVVQVWNADYSQCARIIETTSPTASYSSANQVTDFGAQQQTVYFTVGQVGSAGLGTQARGTAVGAGATDDDPIAPISPYQSPTSGSPEPPPVANALELSIVWDASIGNIRTYSDLAGDFACGEVIVCSFTTPAGTSTDVGNITAAEWNSGAGPIMRTACLSSIPGDFSGTDLGPGSLVHSQSVTVQFTVGPNSRSYPTPELATNTTYYFNIKNDDGFGACTCFTDNCNMFVELRKPHGL